MARKFANFFATKLKNDIDAVTATIALDTLPRDKDNNLIDAGRIVIEARNKDKREIIKYTGIDIGNTALTGCTRGDGRTTATTHSKGAVAEVNVTGEDLSELYTAFESFAIANTSGWYASANLPNVITYLGQGQVQMQFNGVDLTGLWDYGYRFRTTRTTVAPTQMTTLNGSTQDWVRLSGAVAGMSFVDDYTFVAEIELTSFPTTDMAIMGRVNGWWVGLNASGQIVVNGSNGAGSNYRRVVSYRAVPLNRKIRVSGRLDMSGYTLTTSGIEFDDEPVEAYLVTGGTNPTSLVQSGDFAIGSLAGIGGTYFPGKIGQVALFNGLIPAATLRGYSSQGMTGTEPSCIGFWSMNGVSTDGSANANTLTARNSAAYVADSPFSMGGTNTASKRDFAILTDKVYSGGNTTITLQMPRGSKIPTTGGITALDYSNVKKPFGFPIEEDLWQLVAGWAYQDQISSAGAGIWTYKPSHRMQIPTGSWRGGAKGSVLMTSGGSPYSGITAALSTLTNALSDQRLAAGNGAGINLSTVQAGQAHDINEPIRVTAQTQQWNFLLNSNISGATVYWSGSPTANGLVMIKATLAYL